MIWYYCLPRRVIDFMYPTPLPAYHEAGQMCNFRKSTRAAWISEPLIGLICKEARQVVLANGHRRDKPPGSKNHPTFWWQPDIDVLHLNWRGWPSVSGEGDCRIYQSELPHFLSVANRGSRSAPLLSLSYIFIDAFLTKFHYYNLPTHTWFYDPNPEWKNMQLLAETGCGSHIVAVKTITLHISEEDALQSGLFGMLGEELVQLVDVMDTERIRAYHELWTSRAHDASIPEALESYVCDSVSETFRTLLAAEQIRRLAADWHQRVAIQLLKSVWLEARDAGFPNIENPEGIWEPSVPDGEDEEPLVLPYAWTNNLPLHVPNEDHPWGRRTRSVLPVLVPKIMFRCCLDQECLLLTADPNATTGHFFFGDDEDEDPAVPVET